jgi:hypothetical protein
MLVEAGMRRVLCALLAAVCLGGCTAQIEVQSNTRWSGFVNNAEVSSSGYSTYELWRDAPGFMFWKETEAGYLRVRFKKGYGDEPETTAPYGTIWGSAW